MNLYVAGAALGAATTAAVLAVWVFGSSGKFSGVGANRHTADPARPLDVRVAPYMARVDYQNGASALVPISMAFRVADSKAGAAFCAHLARVEHEVKALLAREMGAQFAWKDVATSGLDTALAGQVNRALGDTLVQKVFLAPGDQDVGQWPTTCETIAMMR